MRIDRQRPVEQIAAHRDDHAQARVRVGEAREEIERLGARPAACFASYFVTISSSWSTRITMPSPFVVDVGGELLGDRLRVLSERRAEELLERRVERAP